MSRANRQLGDTTPFLSRKPTLEAVERTFAEPHLNPREQPTADGKAACCVGGRYQLLEEIACGGMGEIMRARDRVLHRTVAIKVLRKCHQSDSRLRRRFLEEAQIMGNLQHPGIAPIFDLGELEDGRPFFAMKLVDGNSMRDLLSQRQHPRDDLARNLRVLEGVSQTIAYAHERRIVHRDLKPLNIMIGVFGEVLVMDWGLSKRLERVDFGEDRNDDPWNIPSTDETLVESRPGGPLEALEDLSRWGEILGTIEYLAPEQSIGAKHHGDERTDVFGLGAILCEVLTGKPPYWHEKHHELVRMALAADLAPARERLMQVGQPRELVQLAIDCLQPAPDHRPKDASTVAITLARHLDASIRAAESDLIRFFEFSQDLFCIAGLDGFFRRVNPNFIRVMGYSEDQLLAKPFLEFVHPDDHDSTHAAVAQLAANAPVVAFRNRYRDAEGKYRVLEWSAKSIPEEGVIFAVAREVQPS